MECGKAQIGMHFNITCIYQIVGEVKGSGSLQKIKIILVNFGFYSNTLPEQGKHFNFLCLPCVLEELPLEAGLW